MKSWQSVQHCWWTRGWIHYLVGVFYVELLFLGLRLTAFTMLFDEYASQQQHQSAQVRHEIQTWGFMVGFLQDFCLLVLMVVVLRLFDTMTKRNNNNSSSEPLESASPSLEDVYVSALEDQPTKQQKAPEEPDERVVMVPTTSTSSSSPSPWVHANRSIGCKTLRFGVYAVVFLIVVVPFCLDNVLFRARKMRFTMDFLRMYLRDRNYSGDLALAKRETEITHEVLILLALFTIGFGLLGALVLDLTRWSPTQWLATWIVGLVRNGCNCCSRKPCQPLGSSNAEHSDANTLLEPSSTSPEQAKPSRLGWFTREASQITMVQWLLTVGGLLLLVWMTYAASWVANRLSTTIGLNTTLNEYFHSIIGLRFMPLDGKFDINSADLRDMFLDPSTEQFELSESMSLYRRTTGFHGDLSFDVQVDPNDPPNVLVINVESFRYQDSAYLTNHSQVDPLNYKNASISVTPQFDKWARRNIAFRNLWSNWRTSRAIEAILFGHATYDSTTESLTTTGRRSLKLQGMPQFFKQKGYECMFSTAARDGYDQWNEFLPTHGFETSYYGNEEYQQMARDAGYDLKKNGLTWNWGLHDDLSFELLGNLLEKRQQEQAADGTKKPFFMNHYTISSHTPFAQRPDWYANFVKHNNSFPDFSPLYNQEKYRSDVKNYVEMRYFTDMALGKFLDRMKANGLLNDTIVLIAGDHGQAPENGLPQPELRYLPIHHVAGALIAEGRLGKYAGTIIDELAHHNDFINTLADIVGVPKEGFYQTSIGRSLKRKLANPSKRIVHVSNPMTEYALIQSNLRVQYDKLFDSVHVHDITNDPLLQHDLYPQMYHNESQREAIDKLRSAGRFVNAYFRDRVQRNCITSNEC